MFTVAEFLILLVADAMSISIEEAEAVFDKYGSVLNIASISDNPCLSIPSICYLVWVNILIETCGKGEKHATNVAESESMGA